MARFLRELALQQEVGFELIVSHGGSADGSKALARRRAGGFLPRQGGGRGRPDQMNQAFSTCFSRPGTTLGGALHDRFFAASP